LKEHEKVHESPVPFVCIYCGKWFPEPTSLESHTLRHNKSELFSCIVCFETFREESQLDLHVDSHRVVVPKVRVKKTRKKCLMCGNRFVRTRKVSETQINDDEVPICRKCTRAARGDVSSGVNPEHQQDLEEEEEEDEDEDFQDHPEDQVQDDEDMPDDEEERDEGDMEDEDDKGLESPPQLPILEGGIVFDAPLEHQIKQESVD